MKQSETFQDLVIINTNQKKIGRLQPKKEQNKARYAVILHESEDCATTVKIVDSRASKDNARVTTINASSGASMISQAKKLARRRYNANHNLPLTTNTKVYVKDNR